MPTPVYGAPTYAPAAPTYHQPAPPAYHEPAPPAYHVPVGPVLLDKRPYEVTAMQLLLIKHRHLHSLDLKVKSVQPLPITVAETYTGFDCRSKPYQGRHYADPEAGCEVTPLLSCIMYLIQHCGNRQNISIQVMLLKYPIGVICHDMFGNMPTAWAVCPILRHDM